MAPEVLAVEPDVGTVAGPPEAQNQHPLRPLRRNGKDLAVEANALGIRVRLVPESRHLDGLRPLPRPRSRGPAAGEPLSGRVERQVPGARQIDTLPNVGSRKIVAAGEVGGRNSDHPITHHLRPLLLHPLSEAPPPEPQATPPAYLLKPDIRPLTMWRWATPNRITAGVATIRLNAITGPHSTRPIPMKFVICTGSVRSSAE